MRWPMLPVTRRAFALSLLIAPMACLGCGGGDTVTTEGGAKQRQRIENLEKKADSIRSKSGNKKAP